MVDMESELSAGKRSDERNARDTVHACERESHWRGRAEAYLLAVHPEQKADGVGLGAQP